jgi:hypothetical protein
VFDVHGGAKLVLDHVSVTGGGGGPSTADPHHIHGGAIHNHGTIELTYVTITGNSALDATDTAAAPGGGGGIYNATGATAKLTNVTIAGNVAAISNMNTIPLPLGGGIAGPGTFTLRNTVIANNVAGATASNCGGSKPMNIIDEGGNLQFPGNDCGRLVTITLPRTGTSHTFWAPFFPTAVFDPLLPLDAVRTIFLPAPNGPAVDSGVAGCGPTDQAGRPAPRDGNGDGVVACDSGAVEAP